MKYNIDAVENFFGEFAKSGLSLLGLVSLGICFPTQFATFVIFSHLLRIALRNLNTRAMQKETCNFEFCCRGFIVQAKLILPVNENGILQMDGNVIRELFVIHAGFLPEGGDEIDVDLLEKKGYPDEQQENEQANEVFSRTYVWN
jgi:hypothetical protein